MLIAKPSEGGVGEEGTTEEETKQDDLVLRKRRGRDNSVEMNPNSFDCATCELRGGQDHSIARQERYGCRCGGRHLSFPGRSVGDREEFEPRPCTSGKRTESRERDASSAATKNVCSKE